MKNNNNKNIYFSPTTTARRRTRATVVVAAFWNQLTKVHQLRTRLMDRYLIQKNDDFILGYLPTALSSENVNLPLTKPVPVVISFLYFLFLSTRDFFSYPIIKTTVIYIIYYTRRLTLTIYLSLSSYILYIIYVCTHAWIYSHCASAGAGRAVNI